MAGGGVGSSRTPPFWWRHRRAILAITLGVILGGVSRLFVGNATGEAHFGWTAFLITAAPSLLAVVITRYWRVWVVQCALAIAAWGPFLAFSLDLSCTDCGFALLWPLYLALPQAVLVLVGLLAPAMRKPPT